jgi:hypothetical protein
LSRIRRGVRVSIFAFGGKGVQFKLRQLIISLEKSYNRSRNRQKRQEQDYPDFGGFEESHDYKLREVDCYVKQGFCWIANKIYYGEGRPGLVFRLNSPENPARAGNQASPLQAMSGDRSAGADFDDNGLGDLGTGAEDIQIPAELLAA